MSIHILYNASSLWGFYLQVYMFCNECIEHKDRSACFWWSYVVCKLQALLWRLGWASGVQGGSIDAAGIWLTAGGSPKAPTALLLGIQTSLYSTPGPTYSSTVHPGNLLHSCSSSKCLYFPNNMCHLTEPAFALPPEWSSFQSFVCLSGERLLIHKASN